MGTPAADAAALYFELLRRVLRKVARSLFSRDAVILAAVLTGVVGLSVFSCGVLSLPASVLGGALYARCLGQVVSGSRLGWYDVKKAASGWRTAWAGALLFGVLFMAGTMLSVVTGLGLFMMLPWLLPVPELVALERGRDFGGVTDALTSFLQENWAPWLGVNVVASLLFSLLTVPVGALVGTFVGLLAFGSLATVPDLGALSPEALLNGPFPVLMALGVTVAMALVLMASLVATHVLMLFRCHAFALLDGTTHRARLFRFRSGAL